MVFDKITKIYFSALGRDCDTLGLGPQPLLPTQEPPSISETVKKAKMIGTKFFNHFESKAMVKKKVMIIFL